MASNVPPPAISPMKMSARSGSSLPPPVISPVKKSARLGKNRSLIKKTNSSRSSARSSSRRSISSRSSNETLDTDRSRQKKIEDKIKSIHNRQTDKIWAEQKKKAIEKSKYTSAKKAAMQVFEKLHAYGEERYNGEHDEITKMYHMVEHDYIDFDSFYHVLQEHYFDQYVTKQSALSIFNFVDKEKKGSISFDQLHHVYDEAVRHLGSANKQDDNCQGNATAELSLPNVSNMTTTQKAIATLTDEEMILRKRALKRMNELKYTIQQKMLPKVKTSLEKHLRETYNIADVNGDGNLSYEEFADWLGNGPTGLNVGFTKDDIRDITLACDADLDGGISVDEFIDFVTRKNKLDPRSFLNDKRQEKVNYMRSLRRRTLKNMRKKVDHGNTARTVDTDHSTDDKLSTRLWYEDSNSTQDGDVYANEAKRVEVEKIQGSDMSGACKTTDISRRLGRTIEADLERHMEEKHKHRLRFYAERDAESFDVRKDKQNSGDNSFVPKRRNMKKSFSSPTLSARSATLRRAKYRSRRPRQVLQTRLDIGSAAHHQLPGGDVNALVSKINFENMAKEIWKCRWDGRGRDFKPDWVNRLTFNRVGLGGNNSLPKNSAMYQSEEVRRKNILNTSASTVNPAGKFIDEDRERKVREDDLHLIRTRFYLRKNKRNMRTKVKKIDHYKRVAERARLFNKTSQQLRYLEVLNDIEERIVNQTYKTKGMIKSPEAARMKAGSVQLFRPPSGRGEKHDNLQTGIGTRQAAIVTWSY